MVILSISAQLPLHHLAADHSPFAFDDAFKILTCTSWRSPISTFNLLLAPAHHPSSAPATPPSYNTGRLKLPQFPSSALAMPKKTTGRTGGAIGKKKKKDPSMPKRGLSAYMFFANAQRDIVRDENPGISFGQVGKVLGERWKNLDEEKRKPYQELAEEDKARYEREKAQWQDGLGNEE